MEPLSRAQVSELSQRETAFGTPVGSFAVGLATIVFIALGWYLPKQRERQEQKRFYEIKKQLNDRVESARDVIDNMEEGLTSFKNRMLVQASEFAWRHDPLLQTLAADDSRPGDG